MPMRRFGAGALEFHQTPVSITVPTIDVPVQVAEPLTSTVRGVIRVAVAGRGPRNARADELIVFLERRSTPPPDETWISLAPPELTVVPGVTSPYSYVFAGVPLMSNLTARIRAVHQEFGVVVAKRFTTNASGALATHDPVQVLDPGQEAPPEFQQSRPSRGLAFPEAGVWPRHGPLGVMPVRQGGGGPGRRMPRV